MNASGDKKAVPIGDLSIERLSALQKQVEHEITFFAESLNVSSTLILCFMNFFISLNEVSFRIS